MLYCINSVNIDEVLMPTVRKTITITDTQEKWIQSRIEAGDFTNESEYIRDLVRHDQDRNATRAALQSAIDDGLASGVSDKRINDVWRAAEARHTAKNA